MTVVTSRADFEKLTEIRMVEAKHLLIQEDWDGAYYLAGYAVEFALKIRMIARLMKSDSFPDRKLTENFYKHDLTVIRKSAGLDDEMDEDGAVSPQWDTVKDWSKQSRYQIGKTKKEAKDFYDAIENGVLPWIKAHW